MNVLSNTGNIGCHSSGQGQSTSLDSHADTIHRLAIQFHHLGLSLQSIPVISDTQFRYDDPELLLPPQVIQHDRYILAMVKTYY